MAPSCQVNVLMVNDYYTGDHTRVGNLGGRMDTRDYVQISEIHIELNR